MTEMNLEEATQHAIVDMLAHALSEPAMIEKHEQSKRCVLRGRDAERTEETSMLDTDGYDVWSSSCIFEEGVNERYVRGEVIWGGQPAGGAYLYWLVFMGDKTEKFFFVVGKTREEWELVLKEYEDA